ncbi:MAG: RNA polymerase sigma factor [Woeseia sp.]
MSGFGQRQEASNEAMAHRAGKKPDGENERESALLRRIVQRDRSAIAELYRLYHARLFKFVFRLTHSYSVADELVNDVMLLVWQNAASFRGDSRASTWIFGIAWRQAMRRASRGKNAHLQPARADEPARDDRADIERRDWVWRGLRKLPQAQQLTTVLVFYYGLSYLETAEITHCSVNTVKTRMFHARRKLREYLAEPETAEPRDE